jgi:hypothetical protein
MEVAYLNNAISFKLGGQVLYLNVLCSYLQALPPPYKSVKGNAKHQYSSANAHPVSNRGTHGVNGAQQAPKKGE